MDAQQSKGTGAKVKAPFLPLLVGDREVDVCSAPYVAETDSPPSRTKADATGNVAGHMYGHVWFVGMKGEAGGSGGSGVAGARCMRVSAHVFAPSIRCMGEARLG